MWGATWLTASLGAFFVLARKEARLEQRDRSPRTEIHASFSQLTLVAGGTLIYGISFVEHLSWRVGRPDPRREERHFLDSHQVPDLERGRLRR